MDVIAGHELRDHASNIGQYGKDADGPPGFQPVCM